jgi:hypothetical protein
MVMTARNKSLPKSDNNMKIKLNNEDDHKNDLKTMPNHIK